MKQPLVTRASHRVWLIAPTKSSLHSSLDVNFSVRKCNTHTRPERERVGARREGTPADISGISHENQRDILAPPSFEFLIFLESEPEAALPRLSPFLPPSVADIK